MDLTPSEKLIKRLSNKHQLDRVEITVGNHATSVRAMPASHSPVIAERREAALQKHAAAGAASLSMQEATAMTEAIIKEPVARGSGKSIEEAIAAMKEALEK